MFVDPCIIVQFIKINPTRCNNVLKFCYSMFIWSSTCFGRHTAHHQEPKTALAASGLSYVEGWWTCSWWTLSGTVWEGAVQRPPITRPSTFHVWKTRGSQCSFRLLMMSGVSPETCWASYKHGIIRNFDTVLHLVWFFFMNLWMGQEFPLFPLYFVVLAITLPTFMQDSLYFAIRRIDWNLFLAVFT